MTKTEEPEDLTEKYHDLIDEKAERREKKKTKKMPVHSSGLHDIWKIKSEKVEKPEKEVDKEDVRRCE